MFAGGQTTNVAGLCVDAIADVGFLVIVRLNELGQFFDGCGRAFTEQQVLDRLPNGNTV